MRVTFKSVGDVDVESCLLLAALIPRVTQEGAIAGISENHVAVLSGPAAPVSWSLSDVKRVGIS